MADPIAEYLDVVEAVETILLVADVQQVDVQVAGRLGYDAVLDCVLLGLHAGV